MNPDKYGIPSTIERALAILELLAEHAVSGLTPGEISAGIASSKSCTTRDLAALRSLGYVEEARAPGRWRIAPKLPQLALHVQRSIESARHDVDQTQQRLTRTPT